MPQWVDWPLDGNLNKNVSSAILTADTAESIENCYINDVKGLSRVPQLSTFMNIPPQFPVYLKEWNDDFFAVCGGRTFNISLNGTYTDVTGETVAGGKRVIFSETEDELVMAAGKNIIRYRGALTESLSADAPESTHVGWVSSYIIAIEKDSQRFQFASAPYTIWNPLDILAAEGSPDPLNALLVTEFKELLLAGDDSIEQFEPTPSGDSPFYRRWFLGAGIFKEAPYTFISVDNKAWGINSQKEFVSFSTQLGNIASTGIQKELSQIDNWKDAYAIELPIDGQYFILLQMPYATNIYGSKGITYLYEYKRKKWSQLYALHPDFNTPERWPGWSYAEYNNRKFIGGTGKIYEIGGFGGEFGQRMLWRSGHLQMNGGSKFEVSGLQVKVERGKVAINSPAPTISLRVNKDNRGFGRYVRRSLNLTGRKHMFVEFGNLGQANSFQIEISVTDAIDVQIGGVKVYVDGMSV